MTNPQHPDLHIPNVQMDVRMAIPMDVQLRVCYRQEWQDGFGARGWKLANALHDPEIIASTPATGERIPTSVLVHDMLDHALCGLPPSGHRAEAVALMQLAARTGADPRPDFAQMVDEDLLQGRVNGESARSFLPDDLLDALPDAAGVADERLLATLVRTLDRSTLRTRLIAHFFTLGQAGAARAMAHYRAQGLDTERRGALGLALQQVFGQADRWVVEQHLDMAEGSVGFTADQLCFKLEQPTPWVARGTY